MFKKKHHRGRSERKKILTALLRRHKMRQFKVWRDLEKDLDRWGFTDEFPEIGQLLIATLELKRSIYLSHRLGTEFLKKLSPRQREVARLCARGLKSKDIAGRTGMPLGTVGTHLGRARHKCDVHSNEEFSREIPLLS